MHHIEMSVKLFHTEDLAHKSLCPSCGLLVYS